jgi:hypothetical protein
MTLRTGLALQSQPHYDWGAVLVSRNAATLDLAAEIYHLREPQKIPLVMSADETRRRAVQRSGTSVTGQVLSGLHHRYVRI